MRLKILRLNLGKTEVLLVRPDLALEGDCNLRLDRVVLRQKDRVHSLGVLPRPGPATGQTGGSFCRDIGFHENNWFLQGVRLLG